MGTMEYPQLPEDAMRLFQVEAEYDDTKIQIQAINRILPVAIALGEERTRLELIPYLNAYLDKTYINDEIQMNVAIQIANLVDLIGGEEHVDLLFELLHKLVSAEEGLVRCSATEAMRSLVRKISTESFQDKFIPFLVKLKMDDWFTSKLSLLELVPYIYEKLADKLRWEMRQYVIKCCDEEESPLVRKTAARCLINFVDSIEEEHIETNIISGFNLIAQDTQDTIRMLAIDIAVSLSRRISHKAIIDHILPTIERFEGDESWKIRAHVANQILNLQRVMGPTLTRKTLVNVLTNLAKDNEYNVRKEVAGTIVQFCKSLQESTEHAHDLDPIVNTELLPLIIELAEDKNPEIEGCVTMHFSDLCKLLGPARSREYLMPIVLNLIKISIDNIREEYIINLNTYIKEIGIDNIKESIQEILTHLMDNKSCNWRSKREGLSTLFLTVQQTDAEYFQKEMIGIYKHLLRDTVYSVRKVAPILVPVLIKKYGLKWFETNLLSACLKPARHDKYLHRIACLSVIDEVIAPTLESQKWNSVFHTLQSAITDSEHKDDASRLLCRIIILANRLEEAFQEDWIHQLINLYDCEEYYNDHMTFYAENVVNDIATQMDNIIKITEDDYNNPKQDCYVESVLILLIKHLIPCIESLRNDKIENVQLRAARTLNHIQLFLQTLLKSLSVEWIRNFYSSVEQTTKDNLTAEVKDILHQDSFDDLTYSSDEEESDSRHGTLRRTSRNATIAEFERWTDTIGFVTEENEVETSTLAEATEVIEKDDSSVEVAEAVVESVVASSLQSDTVNGSDDSVNV